MPFLSNAWYAAAWEDEVGGGPLGRTLLDEPLIIYKGAAGQPVALSDLCPHRFAPLSEGRQEGDTIRCPYHGLVFDSSGACVHNPHGAGVIRPSLKVRRYPCRSRDGMIWVWMGDEAAAAGTAPPSYSFLGQDGWAVMTGYLHVSAQYELVTDNLLDLSHAEFLHPFIAPPGTASSIQYEAVQDGDRVVARHTMPPSPNTPLFRILMPEVDEVDGWAHMHWEAPANMMLDTGATPTGRPPEAGARLPQAHLLTPETSSTTHYFWGLARDRAQDDEQLGALLRAGISNAFENEDEPMIRKIQQRMRGKSLFEMNPALLPMDAAAVTARRILSKKIGDQQSAIAPGETAAAPV